MELGLHFVDYRAAGIAQLGPTLAQVARTAEQAGMTMFTLADHYLGLGPDAQDPFLECYTSLGFLAGQTDRITLGTMVTGVSYHNPGQLAKTVSTLDVLSGGRALLGIGSAWYERGHVALGIPFPTVGERFEMLEETLQICLQMWSDNDGPYQGEHYQLGETICAPQPIRRPPILIPGGGERKTLRLVAQYADVWTATAETVEEFEHKLDVLNRHCEAVGRNPAEIRKTVGLFFRDPFDNLDDYLKTMQRLAELGASMVNVGAMPGNPDPIGFIGRLGDELVPRLAAIG
ncbi:LLM class F420-dependent oxidoreductase [Mycobacterium sp.]|uniref:LLM class F420-dependent oxidoreductase n=1 Tax=Mycobacterium sp. TaxID=1785 RepID=UPI0025E27422|nr:LLM class F420-dependent oxidoreductase [Mycobacterium sp.]MBW0012985.1 LLM class F420-dependent oxidoreductase [Mycobacterium sp.]